MNQPARIAIAGTVIVSRLVGFAIGVMAFGEVVHWGAMWWESRRQA